MSAVFACNAYVDAAAPWALKKTDPEAHGRRCSAHWSSLIRQLAEAVAPVVPGIGARR